MASNLKNGFTIFLVLISIVGCSDRRRPTAPPAFYAAKLTDPQFRWDGPVSSADRIPVSHAARALAYIGDPAVPYLLDAVENEEVNATCVFDALSEIGLPVGDFSDEIVQKRDATAIRRWWEQNKDVTRAARNKYRTDIGLPPVDAFTYRQGIDRGGDAGSGAVKRMLFRGGLA